MRAMPSYQNPLTAEDCAALTAIGQSCHGTAELIQHCKDCGLPVDEQEAANNAQMEMAKALKAKFFPYNP